MGWHPSNCAISASVQLWWPVDLMRMALMSRVGSSIRRPMSIACLIRLRTALRSVLAACGFAKPKHEFPPEICRPLVTMILTEPLDGTSIDVLRARSQRPKLRGAKVTQRQGGHGPRAGARRGRARLAGQCGL